MGAIDLVASLERRQSALAARADDLMRPPPSPDELVTIQQRYDPAYRSLGTDGAPPPLVGESSATYRARLASDLQPYGTTWRDADLYGLAGADALAPIEATILAEVSATVDDRGLGDFDHPARLRRVDSIDPETGRRSIEWRGDPSAWMNTFAPDYQVVRSVRDARGRSIPYAVRWGHLP